MVGRSILPYKFMNKLFACHREINRYTTAMAFKTQTIDYNVNM